MGELQLEDLEVTGLVIGDLSGYQNGVRLDKILDDYWIYVLEYLYSKYEFSYDWIRCWMITILFGELSGWCFGTCFIFPFSLEFHNPN